MNFLNQLPDEFKGFAMVAVGIGIVVLIVLAGLWVLFTRGILKIPASVKFDVKPLEQKINELGEATARSLDRMDQDIGNIRKSAKYSLDRIEDKMSSQAKENNDNVRRIHDKIETLVGTFVPVAQCTVCHESQRSYASGIGKQLDDFKSEVRADLQSMTSAINNLMRITP